MQGTGVTPDLHPVFTFAIPKSSPLHRSTVEGMTNTTPNIAHVYYYPEFAAEGGPPPNGPIRSPHAFMEDTAAGVALVYLATESLWVIMDSNGNTFAEATDPGELADWLSDYAVTLGEMHRRGELS
jgi:hypothetical protein